MSNYIRKTPKKTVRADQNWSTEEDALLREHYPTLGAKGVAPLLRRTVGACRNRASVLKIGSERAVQLWTQEEEAFLREHYSQKGAAWCAEKLGRSKSGCIYHASKLGFRSGRYWTSEEDAVLRAYYAEIGAVGVSRLIDRTPETCQFRAAQMGIRYHNTALWTQEEIDCLRELYPSGGAAAVAARLNRTVSACQCKALLEGIHHLGWPEEDKEFLRTHYPAKGAVWVGEQLGRDPRNCISMASKLGVRYINPNAWTEEEIAALRVYYPELGRSASCMIPTKSANACQRRAQLLGLRYRHHESAYTRRIKRYLNIAAIPYAQEASFPDCADKRPLRFDFVLYRDETWQTILGVVEFDGAQHFATALFYCNSSASAAEQFERICRHDQIKNRFCEETGIPLLRIKYTQEDRTEELLEVFLAQPQQYIRRHNPYIAPEQYYAYAVAEGLYDKLCTHITAGEGSDFRRKCREYGLTIHKWSDTDDLFLRENYSQKGAQWCGEHLGRSHLACRVRAGKLGLHMDKFWTAREDAVLREHYPALGAKGVAPLLGRTVNACSHRAIRLDVRYDRFGKKRKS